MTPRRPRGGGEAGGPRSVAHAEEAIAAEVGPGLGRPSAKGEIGPQGSPGVGGPPWAVDASVPGSARGMDLSPPHRRHTIAGTRSGLVQADNTVYLRGYEDVATRDVQAIAAGQATWNTQTQRYEISGRSYGVEPNGTVFPDSGPGMVKLDRNEYAALKEIVRAGGDVSAAPQLSRNPRFLDNPEAVAKAKAIYDGTYEP